MCVGRQRYGLDFLSTEGKDFTHPGKSLCTGMTAATQENDKQMERIATSQAQHHKRHKGKRKTVTQKRS